jgi:lipopolysaccharide biosynthesis regulator YciM
MEESNSKNYTRDECIYLSKLYEKAERYPDMLKAIRKMIELNPKLKKEECDILSTGYKNMITDKRNSWRILNSMERREKKNKKSKIIKNILEIKSHIEKEIREVCTELQILLDKYLIPNVEEYENEVYLYKLKADYYRYICEFAKEKEYEDNLKNSENFYEKAYNISIKNLPVNNCTRVGLALNYAIFLYEVKGDKKVAFDIAKKTFDESMKFVDDLEKPKCRDTLLIIQLLKENLIFWSSEMNEDEENKNAD